MANFFLTQDVVAGMLGSTGLTESIDAGTAAVINIYDGTAPVDADAALAGNTLLAQLTCSATAFTSITDQTGKARATFAAITSDSSADATGTASFFRILTQSAGTVIGQGNVATTDAALVLNTTAIAAASTVSITSAWIELSEGGTF